MKTCSVRPATVSDLDWVKRMADRHRREVGFVLRPALADAIERGELLVGIGASAFCRWHARRDGWHTVYELVSEAGAGDGTGRALLDALPRPLRLKCPTDLEANGFYARCGGTLARVEPGKRRPLNVWQWSPSST